MKESHDAQDFFCPCSCAGLVAGGNCGASNMIVVVDDIPQKKIKWDRTNPRKYDVGDQIQEPPQFVDLWGLGH